MLANYFARQRAIILVECREPGLARRVQRPGVLDKTIASEGGPRCATVDVALRSLRPRTAIGQRGVLHRAERSGGGTTRPARGPATCHSGGRRALELLRPADARPPERRGVPGASVHLARLPSVGDRRRDAGSGRGFGRGILHFEVPSKRFAKSPRAGGGRPPRLGRGRADGDVVFDTSRRQRIGAPLGARDRRAVSTAGLGRSRPRGVSRPMGGASPSSGSRASPGVRTSGTSRRGCDAAPACSARRWLRRLFSRLMVLALMGSGPRAGAAVGRSPARRGANGAPGDARRAHGPAQPAAVPRPHRAGDRAARRDGIETAVMLMDVDGSVRSTTPSGTRRRPVIAAVATRLRGVLRSATPRPARRRRVRYPHAADHGGVGRGPARRAHPDGARRPLVLHGVLLDIRASIGVAVYPDHGGDVNTLLQHAEIAMYVAKDTRTALQVYDPSTDEHSTERLALVGELRHALDRGEIVVHYQPKATMFDGRVRSVEALVRWQHPERGLLGPYEFVHLAEHTGLIRPLTHHVLAPRSSSAGSGATAGSTCRSRSTCPSATSSTSTSPGRSPPSSTAAGSSRGPSGSRSPRRCSCSTRTATIEVLARLHEMGVHMSLDDFGTG